MVDHPDMPAAVESPGLFNRTLRTFRRALRGTGLASVGSREAVEPELLGSSADRLREQIQACLEARGGEVDARARAAALGSTYLGLNAEGRRRFATILAEDFEADPSAIHAAIEDYQQAEVETRHRAQARLRTALVAPRVRLLTRFNQLSLGVKFLVDLRADIRNMSEPGPALRGLESDLKELLVSWFDIGFLELTRITWRTPAALLEKLIEYEAVHAIRSWDDLKDRLDEDRRCYAFFHPCMPDELLIFVQVALVNGLSDNIHDLLDEQVPVEVPENANTAIFYSISNCQAGLAGVSFGNALIKQVASDLSKELPNVKTFATLSPIPGFRRWLDGELEAQGDALLSESQAMALDRADSNEATTPANQTLATIVDDPETLLASPGGSALTSAVRTVLMQLCARYLLEERHDTRALDRVAHFHLSNGARIERINWMGDHSKQGLVTALGMMVNYRYVLSDVDKNHEAYVSKGTVPAIPSVRKLLRV